MKLTRLTAVVAASAAAALLGACSPLPGTAVAVEGVTISENSIEAAVNGCASALNVETTDLNRVGIVQIMTLGEVSKVLLADSGVTDELIDQAAAASAEMQQMMGHADCAPLARAQVWQGFLSQAAGEDILEQLQGVDVQMNPRYGRWSPDETQIFSQSGSLSTPAASILK